jgi:hypothetical protein
MFVLVSVSIGTDVCTSYLLLSVFLHIKAIMKQNMHTKAADTITMTQTGKTDGS